MKMNLLKKEIVIVDYDKKSHHFFDHYFSNEFDIRHIYFFEEFKELVNTNIENIVFIINLQMYLERKSDIENLLVIKKTQSFAWIALLDEFNLEDENLALEALSIGVITKPLNLNNVRFKLNKLYNGVIIENKAGENKISDFASYTKGYYNALSDVAVLTVDENLINNTVEFGPLMNKIIDCVFTPNESLRNLFISQKVVPLNEQPAFINYLNKIDEDDSYDEKIRIRLRCKTGEYRYYLLHCIRTFVSDRVIKRLYTFTDVDFLVSTQKKLEHMSMFDDLTKMANKNYFYQLTNDVLLANDEKQYILVLLDIAKFKIINDLFGIKQGDKIITIIADCIINRFYEKGYYGRISSDVFCICMEKTEDYLDGIRDLIKDIQERINIDFNIKICVGIYEIVDKTIPVNSMVDRARLAADQIKQNYKLEYYIYNDSLREKVYLEQTLVMDFTKALKEHEFEIYFQPKCLLDSGKIIGAEALVRWNHKEKGVLSPGKFIPILEKNNLITFLDLYVLEETICFIKQRLNEGKIIVPISVNLSRNDMYNPKLLNMIKKLLDKYDLDYNYIIFELTESAYTENKKQLSRVMEEFKNEGFRLAMDDFGSGYSSLNILKDLPVDILKVDLFFLKGEDNLERGNLILSSVIRLAKVLNLSATIEGVETKDQVDYLISIGCIYAQGYYFYKPLKVDEFIKELEANKFDKEITITKNSKWLKKLAAETDEINFFINTFPLPIGLYEKSKSKIELIRANAAYYQFVEKDKEKLFANSLSILDYVDKDDIQMLYQVVADAENKKDDTIISKPFRHICADGTVVYLKLYVKFIENIDDNSSLYFACFVDAKAEFFQNNK